MTTKEDRMFDWIRALFGRSSRTLRDDQISTKQSTLYAPGALEDETSQVDSSGSEYSGGSDSGGSSSGGGDSGGGGGNGGGS
jgi:uncharacterized membrane protein YgcG